MTILSNLAKRYNQAQTEEMCLIAVFTNYESFKQTLFDIGYEV